MQKLNIRMNRRAVSPVIATLLLIAIAVAAAVVTYSWVMSMAANQSQQAQTGIKIDQVLFGSYTGSHNAVVIDLRNTGSIAATIQTIYIFKGDAFITTVTPASGTVSAGSTLEFRLSDSAATWTSFRSGGLPLPGSDKTDAATFGADLAVNTPYIVKIITTTGFVAQGTYYTPGNFA